MGIDDGLVIFPPHSFIRKIIISCNIGEGIKYLLFCLYFFQEYKNPIASDDRPLRKYAEKLGIKMTGSLVILKLLYKRKIIKSWEDYMAHLNSLQKDIYISDELMDWALKE